MEYRLLSEEEIAILESNGCQAENWEMVKVAQTNFVPNFLHRVNFYGEVFLGYFQDSIEIAKGFYKHSGIYNATLKDVVIGNDCLIENISNYIYDCVIGDNCYISNVCKIETTEGATFGEGNRISIPNEAGGKTLTLFHGLNSQLAAFMVRNAKDNLLQKELSLLISEELNRTLPERTSIGNNVKMENTTEIINTIIKDNCEISGAEKLFDTTILSSQHSSVYIGSGVICENCIIGDGSGITNHVMLKDCFVGEACILSNGFTASQSVFFANSHMENGEACAAFCGPFSVSHHKSTLLIGTKLSFYNAGSATNFSNHAYKMGPYHHGELERGCKTASCSYLFMPAQIGAFSVCLGKIMAHPNTVNLPFSYIIGNDMETSIVPGRNFETVGLYRDTKKWAKRDNRSSASRQSIINFEWLSPYTINEVINGLSILKTLKEACGDAVANYTYNGLTIKKTALEKGIEIYQNLLHIYFGKVVARWNGSYERPQEVDCGKWNDLAGLLIPSWAEDTLKESIKQNRYNSIEDVAEYFHEIHENYYHYEWQWAYEHLLDYYQIDELTDESIANIKDCAEKSYMKWLEAVVSDARKELQMGDVDEAVYHTFVAEIEQDKQNYTSFSS